MHAASRNLQRCIHVTFGRKHKNFQVKHVKLCGELLSLRQKLPCFREKLPSSAEDMSARARTEESVRRKLLRSRFRCGIGMTA